MGTVLLCRELWLFPVKRKHVEDHHCKLKTI